MKPFYIKEFDSEPLESTIDDINTAQSIINEYQRANSDLMLKTDSLWGEYNSIFTKEIKSLIKENDKENLAAYLNSFFKKPSVIGFSTGNLYDFSPHRRKFVNLGIVENIVSLAEFLGIIRVETIEQGIPQTYLRNHDGVFTDEKLIHLLDSIKKELNIDISFPRVCGAFGVEIGSYFLTAHSLGHLYRAIRINQFIKNNFDSPITILEIGGGFGGLAYWLNILDESKISQYYSADLPMTNAHSSFFLYKTKTPHKTLCGKDIDHLGKVDLVINEDSFAEMPIEEVHRYLSYITKNSLFFSSYNQEAYSPVNSIPQVSVTEEVAKYDKSMQCMSREKSWVRDGYIEQFFKIIR